MGGLRQRHTLTGSITSARVAEWTQAGVIELIQANTIAIATGTGTNTRAITAVDMNRTVLLHLGTSYGISGTILTGPEVRIALTNSTTVTGTCVVTGDGATATVSFVAITFKVGVFRQPVQRGTLTTAAGTATITAVDTTKSFVNLCGFTTTSNDNQSMPRLALTNATTITITAGGTNGATASYEVWSFV